MSDERAGSIRTYPEESLGRIERMINQHRQSIEQLEARKKAMSESLNRDVLVKRLAALRCPTGGCGQCMGRYEKEVDQIVPFVALFIETADDRVGHVLEFDELVAFWNQEMGASK